MTAPARALLEIIATSAEDAAAAAAGGADRLEVVRDMDADGLTPAADTIARIRERVSLPLRVMLRANAGFGADPRELDGLHRAAADLRAAGADAFVFGFLTPEGALDRPAVAALAAAVAPYPWTFHRAIDHAADARAVWDGIQDQPGLDCVLSGGGPAGLPAGLETLRARAAWQHDRVRWLAGGSLRATDIPILRAAGITQFHAGRFVRVDHRWDRPIDVAAIRHLRALVDGEDTPREA